MTDALQWCMVIFQIFPEPCLMILRRSIYGGHLLSFCGHKDSFSSEFIKYISSIIKGPFIISSLNAFCHIYMLGQATAHRIWLKTPAVVLTSLSAYFNSSSWEEKMQLSSYSVVLTGQVMFSILCSQLSSHQDQASLLRTFAVSQSVLFSSFNFSSIF